MSDNVTFCFTIFLDHDGNSVGKTTPLVKNANTFSLKAEYSADIENDATETIHSAPQFIRATKPTVRLIVNNDFKELKENTYCISKVIITVEFHDVPKAFIEEFSDKVKKDMESRIFNRLTETAAELALRALGRLVLYARVAKRQFSLKLIEITDSSIRSLSLDQCNTVSIAGGHFENWKNTTKEMTITISIV